MKTPMDSSVTIGSARELETELKEHTIVEDGSTQLCPFCKEVLGADEGGVINVK